jgi:serine protease Do
MNPNGQLIGIHRQIGLGSEANLHLSMVRVRDMFQNRPELHRKLVMGAGTAILPAASGGLRKHSLEAISSRTVVVLQKAEGAEARGPGIPGVRLDARRVVTKLSELSPGRPITCRLSNGREQPAQVLREESVTDLIILELDAGAGLPEMAPLEIAKPVAGDLVYAVTGQGEDGVVRISEPGVLGRVNYDEPAVPAKLGAILEEDRGTGFLRFREVSPNGPAAAALIEAGDLLLGMNGQELREIGGLRKLLETRQPGDFLSLNIRHNESRRMSALRLGHDPAERFEKREYLDGRAGAMSFRRTGFRGVCQHDIPLQPLECGGILLNSRGHWVGINIARRSRESTLAIPADQLLREDW